MRWIVGVNQIATRLNQIQSSSLVSNMNGLKALTFLCVGMCMLVVKTFSNKFSFVAIEFSGVYWTATKLKFQLPVLGCILKLNLGLYFRD